MRRRLLWLLVIPAMLILVAVMAPARVAIFFLQQQGWPITATDTAGVWWHGRAEALSFNDRLLGQAHWHWQPWSGQSQGWTVEIQGPDATLKARMTSTRTATVINDVQVEWPAAWVPEMTQTALVGLGGDIHATLSQLQLQHGVIAGAQGQLRWFDAAASVGLQAFGLGHLQADITSLAEGPGARIQFATQDSATDRADILADGYIELSNRNWRAAVTLVAVNDRSRRQLDQWLTLDEQGQTRLEYSGRFEPALLD